MAIELVTGHAGAAHVSGADVGAFNAKTIGDATYILDAALPTLTMADANTLTVPVCEVLAQGRHVRITAPESVTIESGSQTGYRNDIVFLRYTLESTTSVESVELVPVTGTTVASQSDVVDPTTEYSSASILDGATTVDIPLVRVKLDGLTPTPEWTVGTFAALGDSVTELQAKFGTHLNGCHIYQGSQTITVGAARTINVFSPNDFISTFNVDSTTHATMCYVNFVNGDYGANSHHITSTQYGSSSGWSMYLDGNATAGGFRVNYIVIVPDAYSTV